MKLLLDNCLSPAVGRQLRAAGHDVVTVSDWSSDPGDPEIVRRAEAERRVLVTLDKDFGKLAMVHKMPHFGIIRIAGGFRSDQHGLVLDQLLAEHGDLLDAGAMIVVEGTKMRVRLPLR